MLLCGGEGMYLHRNFSSSGLVRLLGRWVPVQPQASGPDVAERLGQWLSVADVITLHAAHQSIRSTGIASPSGACTVGILDVEAELRRVRGSLEKSILARDAAAAHEPDTGYAPYRRRHLEQQRRMAASIDALRDRVRQTLAGVSPRLAQLAELDAVLERMLGRREQQLLATVPLCLEKRFEQLRGQRPGDAHAVPAPGAWLDTFVREFRDALLAELELRLQPVAGMIDALRIEAKQHQ